MSIFKKIKKGFKKLGSAIAKKMRQIGRGVKKGFSKVTRAFGKLGPIGHLALFFMLPGMGGVLSNWMGQFGSRVASFLPEGFSSALTKIGTTIQQKSAFVTDSISSVYNTVSSALKSGIDAITRPFLGERGAATRFEEFVTNTSERFKFKGKEPLSDTELDVEVDKTSKELVAEHKAMSAEARADFKNLPTEEEINTRPLEESKDIKIADAKKDEDSLLRKGVDKLKEVKEKVGDTKIFDTGVSIKEASGVAKDMTGVFTAYEYFNPDNVESGFYNPNLRMANQLNNPNDPFTLSSQATNFVVREPTNNLNTAAQSYVDALNIQGPDPLALALNAPGYGHTFEQYVFGPNYVGDRDYV